MPLLPLTATVLAVCSSSTARALRLSPVPSPLKAMVRLSPAAGEPARVISKAYSLGTLGGVVHTPIINHPEVAIVGPNKIAERVVVKDGQMVVRKMMNLSSSFDHRIVDGKEAVTFLVRLKEHLEDPQRVLLDL